MKLQSPFSFPFKKNKEFDYIKDVYKKQVQNEIDSYLDQEEYSDSIVADDILYLDKIFI